MKFQFPHITPGYMSLKHKQLTLNSAFYATLLTDKIDMNNLITFPQRIPKIEFFDEMSMLEHPDVIKILNEHRNELKNSMNRILISLKNNSSTSRIFLNWLNILLRHGLANEICAIDATHISLYMNANDLTEFKLITEIANFQVYGSTDHNLTKLINLINLAMSNSELNKRIQILVLNYIIVAVYRFNAKLTYQEYMHKCAEQLLNLIEHEDKNDFAAMMRISVAYRGLAMVNEIDISARSQYLNKAESIARDIKPNNELETLVAKENLYTCLQTLSKWHQSIEQLPLAKSNLIEMTELDPYDSTGHAELGFFLFEQDFFEEASHYFKRAAELGFPAVGMHIYYYGKCLQHLGKTDDAINVFYEAIKIDKQAVSPWLDLINCYLDSDKASKAKEIIKLILYTSVYKNQLEKDEIKQLEILM